ncbi:MAG: hypothetical protein WDZ54_12960 [Sneathiella sp.]
MLAFEEISLQEYETFVSILGGRDADIKSHSSVALKSLIEIWDAEIPINSKKQATSIMLWSLARCLRQDYKLVFDAMKNITKNRKLKAFIKEWRIGHFLLKLPMKLVMIKNQFLATACFHYVSIFIFCGFRLNDETPLSYWNSGV